MKSQNKRPAELFNPTGRSAPWLKGCRLEPNAEEQPRETEILGIPPVAGNTHLEVRAHICITHLRAGSGIHLPLPHIPAGMEKRDGHMRNPILHPRPFDFGPGAIFLHILHPDSILFNNNSLHNHNLPEKGEKCLPLTVYIYYTLWDIYLSSS